MRSVSSTKELNVALESIKRAILQVSKEENIPSAVVRHSVQSDNTTSIDIFNEIAEEDDYIGNLLKTMMSMEDIKSRIDNAYTQTYEEALEKAEPFYKMGLGTYGEYTRAVNRCLKVLETSRHNKYFASEEQLRVLYSCAKYLLIDAAAGTGKTATIILKMYLEQAIFNIKKEEILGVTYTDMASNNMTKRYEKLNQDFYTDGDTGQRLTFRTIHKYCKDLYTAEKGSMEIITEDKPVVVEVPNPDYDPEDACDDPYIEKTIRLYQLIENAVTKAGIKRAPTAKSIFSALTTITEFKITDEVGFRDIENYTEYGLNFSQLMQIRKYYNEEKRKYGLIDFIDMLEEAYKLLLDIESRIEAQGKAQVLTNLKDKVRKNVVFKSIYIDEFQDISPLQMEIVKILVRINPDARLTCIGDADQSIYSFRGADVRFILEFPLIFRGDDLDIIYLTRNRRSTKEIIQLSNEFIKGNQSRFPKMIRGLDGDTRKGSIRLFRDDSGLVAKGLIQKRILELKENSVSDLQNVAIVYREHAQAQELLSFMIQIKLPFYCALSPSSPIYVTNNEVMKDFTNIYYLITAPNNYDFIKLVLHKIIPGMSDEDANNISLAIRKRPDTRLSQYLKKNPIWAESIPVITDLIKHVRDDTVSTAEFFMIVASIYKKAYYDEYLENTKKTGVLDLTLEYLKSYPSITQFTSHYNKDLAWLQTNTTNKALCTFTTMHASKGLEWREVYILHLSDTISPKVSKAGKMSPRGRRNYIEEERRLTYVAITRAISDLTIFYKANSNDSLGYFATEIERAFKEVQTGDRGNSGNL